jgi:membrane protein implicated in regulation of membrane protease activity
MICDGSARSRLAFALFGGVALVAPMLIMTLYPSKLTALLTTSLFVIAVAVLLAWRMKDAQNKDIVGATAAYAAVLAVFVGTTISPVNNGSG